MEGWTWTIERARLVRVSHRVTFTIWGLLMADIEPRLRRA
jgi:hypothetical protein